MGGISSSNAFLYKQKIKRFVEYYKQICISRVVADRVEEVRLRESLEFWQVKLHLDPQSEATKSAIKDRRSQLHKIYR